MTDMSYLSAPDSQRSDAAASLPDAWTDQLTALTHAFQQTYQSHVTALHDTIVATWAAWHEDVAALQQMVQQLAAMDAQRAELWTALQTRLDHLTTLIPAASRDTVSVAEPAPPPPAPVAEPDMVVPSSPPLTWAADVSSPSVPSPEASPAVAPDPDDTGLTWNQHDPDPTLPQLVQNL